MNREEIQAEIDKILRQKEAARASLRGREYVHQKQITARRRLFMDLDKRLAVLEEQLNSLGAAGEHVSD